MPGYDVHILHADGNRCETGEEGAICLRLPLPPGTLPTLWDDDDRFEASYLSEHPGYYLTGDGGYIDDDGYLFVMGRIDDVINVAGHRLSTGAIEAVLATHPAVAECAVIGVADEIKGQVPRGLVVLKAGAPTEGLAEELVRAGARRDRRGGRVQARRRRARAAEDPVGQDPAQDDARHRRTAATSRCRRPSRTPRCWRHWRRFCGPDRRRLAAGRGGYLLYTHVNMSRGRESGPCLQAPNTWRYRERR